MTVRRIVPVVLGAMAVLTLLSFLLTLARVPTLWPDSQLYASIARSRQLYGVGVPSALWFSPLAVDHIPFYGPVYFDVVARFFDLFGVSLGSFRIVGVVGALLMASAAALMAAPLSGDRGRWLWVGALVLLTPEIGVSATNGTMEPLAVGFELMALALFVKGIAKRGRESFSVVSDEKDSRPLFAAASGVCLTLAVLTTPRTYPFITAFLASGFLLALPAGGRRIRTQIAIAAAVSLTGVLLWAIRSQGHPARWAAFIAHILSREDTDVAILRTAVRDWSFSWSALVTPAFACLGAVFVAAPLCRSLRSSDERTLAIWFAVLTTVVSGLLTVWGMDFTFTLGIYFALPLFAVLLSLPHPYDRPPENALLARARLTLRPAVWAALVVLIVFDVGVATLKHARIAATWSARNPAPLAAFVQSHVRPDAAVVGPDALYFFAVEGVGARYRSFSESSLADWARWVPSFDPATTRVARRFTLPEPSGRFLILQTGQGLPGGYECALEHEVASFVPPPNYLHRLGRLGNVWDVGYPATTLYQLSPDCPTGYDPTGAKNARTATNAASK